MVFLNLDTLYFSCLDTFRHVQTCLDTFVSFWTCFQTLSYHFRHIFRHASFLHTFRHVQTRFEFTILDTFRHANILDMFRHVQTRHKFAVQTRLDTFRHGTIWQFRHVQTRLDTAAINERKNQEKKASMDMICNMHMECTALYLFGVWHHVALWLSLIHI